MKDTNSAYIQAKTPLPLASGNVPTLIVFGGLEDDKDHFVLDFRSDAVTPTTVRIHSECVTGDVLGSRRCDCGPQLQHALNFLSETNGVLVYLRQEGRGIGLKAKVASYELQRLGSDTYSANRHLGFNDDDRQYGIATQMLLALGINRLNLFSNNPEKAKALEKEGLVVEKMIETGWFITPDNQDYINSKKERLLQHAT